MGCDIHLYIEKKIDGKWVPAQGFMTRDFDDRVPDVPYYDRFTDRNYILFGALAGVREPDFQMFPVKGFPEDACPEVKAVYDQWGCDAHTPSWLTLKELKEADWEKFKAPLTKMFPKDLLKKFRETEKAGKPDYQILNIWCSWAADHKRWETATIDMPIKEQLGRFNDLIFWLNSYDYRCKEDEIRIVFWFDN